MPGRSARGINAAHHSCDSYGSRQPPVRPCSEVGSPAFGQRSGYIMLTIIWIQDARLFSFPRHTLINHRGSWYDRFNMRKKPKWRGRALMIEAWLIGLLTVGSMLVGLASALRSLVSNI